MIRVNQVKVDVLKDNDDEIINSLCHKLKINSNDIISFKINRKSIDARDKENINYIYNINLEILNEEKYLKNKDVIKVENNNYIYPKKGNTKLNNKIVIVGSGPSGLFAALLLIDIGYEVIIIERGKKVEERKEEVLNFWNNNILNENDNVQFGEGGAGTFSDGKLNTMIKDKNGYYKKVMETFVKYGADKSILYESHPHIGTDKLIEIIKNIRNDIISKGGKFLFNTTLTNIFCEDNKLKSIEINNSEIINTDVLMLAIGNASRDTFRMLEKNNVNITSKPFAVGFRIMHSQEFIDNQMYSKKYKGILEKASYKLTYQSNSKRGIYTFCMCPGGYVINSSSEKDGIVTNGMSNSNRDSGVSNSAIIITVNNNDYGNNSLDGMNFQINLEKKAYKLGNGKMPISLLSDYYENNVSKEFKSIKPMIKGGYTFINFNDLFSKEINDEFKDAIKYFDQKIKGFNNPDSIIVGIETRTSSPIRILRDDNYETNIKGIYPVGEGSGYSGGITSSAIDGIKGAEKIIQKYC